MAYPFTQIPDILGIALISSVVLSVIVIALAIKILLLTDVSSPWKLSGGGLIISMMATIVLVYNLYQGNLDTLNFLIFYVCYISTGALIYLSLRQLEMTSRDPSGAGLG